VDEDNRKDKGALAGGLYYSIRPAPMAWVPEAYQGGEAVNKKMLNGVKGGKRNKRKGGGFRYLSNNTFAIVQEPGGT